MLVSFILDGEMFFFPTKDGQDMSVNSHMARVLELGTGIGAKLLIPTSTGISNLDRVLYR